MIAGDYLGSCSVAGFLDDAGTPAGLVFSAMRHNRAAGSIGISNFRAGSVRSTNAAVCQIDAGDRRDASLVRVNRASISLQRTNS